MAHTHTHASNVSRKLTLATAANLLVVVAEISIGAWAGSLALIGDGLHNLTDAFALLIALIAVRLERRAPTSVKSFGYQRAGILAAFINAAMLLTFTLFVFREAWLRFAEPRQVSTGAMLITAGLALLVNGLTAYSLHHDSRDDVNLRGAFLHMIGDAISSAGILVAALLIRLTGSPRWDSGVSVLIGVLILWSSYGVLRESVNLLLEGTPSAIDPAAVTQSLGDIDGIYGVHHLHIWALGPSSPALSCHLMVGDVPLKDTARILDEIKAMLSADFRIAHTTIQFEFAMCAEDDPYCVPFSRRRAPPA
ncbi:MAG: cation diffusion facilitator family transporter [Acidobacteriota bacterium]